MRDAIGYRDSRGLERGQGIANQTLVAHIR